MLGEQPAWIVGIIFGVGAVLTIFVVIPTIIKWIWYVDPFKHDEQRSDDE